MSQRSCWNACSDTLFIQARAVFWRWLSHFVSRTGAAVAVKTNPTQSKPDCLGHDSKSWASCNLLVRIKLDGYAVDSCSKHYFQTTNMWRERERLNRKFWSQSQSVKISNAPPRSAPPRNVGTNLLERCDLFRQNRNIRKRNCELRRHKKHKSSWTWKHISKACLPLTFFTYRRRRRRRRRRRPARGGGVVPPPPPPPPAGSFDRPVPAGP